MSDDKMPAGPGTTGDQQTAMTALVIALTFGAGSALAEQKMGDMKDMGMGMGKQQMEGMKSMDMGGQKAMSGAQGNVQRGAALFQQCAACHSLAPGRHLTGPSLADVFGRQAGAAEGFLRYSDPLQRSGLVWNAQNLDRWLKNPQALVPGNGMPFQGIDDGRARADLIAYLKVVTEGKEAPAASGGMGMMMGQGPKENLKRSGSDSQVMAIRYCPDAYRVTTAGGQTFTFWEHNLRFKTDSSAEGPHSGKPVLARAGMVGDRAFVVFAGPEEMATFIKRQCD